MTAPAAAGADQPIGFAVVYTTSDDGTRTRLWSTTVFDTRGAAAAALVASLERFSPAFYRLQVVALTPFRHDPAAAEQDQLAAARERLRGNVFGGS